MCAFLGGFGESSGCCECFGDAAATSLQKLWHSSSSNLIAAAQLHQNRSSSNSRFQQLSSPTVPNSTNFTIPVVSAEVVYSSVSRKTLSPLCWWRLSVYRPLDFGALSNFLFPRWTFCLSVGFLSSVDFLSISMAWLSSRVAYVYFR